MSRVIPNLDQVGNDYSLSPVEVKASVVIIDNGTDCLWYPGATDPPTAERIAFTIRQSSNVDAFSLAMKLILPSATELRSFTSELDQLSTDPLRALIRTK